MTEVSNPNVLVDVLMITYNHESFIEEAIKGVIKQKTKFKFRLRIFDDCSTDRTEEIIQSLLKHENPNLEILYTRNERNLGMIGNGIQSLKSPRSEYVALCEGDDYWTDPLKLQKQIDFLNEENEYVLCHHSCKSLKTIDDKVFFYDDIVNDSKYFDEYSAVDLMKGAMISTCTLVFRNVFQGSHDFPKEFIEVSGGDVFLRVLLGTFGKGKFIEDIEPAIYRVHEGGIFSGASDFNKKTHRLITRIWILSYLKRTKQNKEAILFHNHFIKKQLRELYLKNIYVGLNMNSIRRLLKTLSISLLYIRKDLFV